MTDATHGAIGARTWLPPISKAGLIAIMVAAGGLMIHLDKVVDVAWKYYDRTRPSETFVLAESSAKSVFSGQLSQRAWRRLFWAANFRARVINAAPIEDIDSSWKSYVDADADWNANIMISIVGLDRYYGRKRADQLEETIQNLFVQLDDALARLRNSQMVRSIRAGRTPTDQEKAEAEGLAAQARDFAQRLNVELYVLVRCIAPKGEQSFDSPCK
jgi:hypothetical protein